MPPAREPSVGLKCGVVHALALQRLGFDLVPGVSLGERRHDHRRPDVPDGAGQQDRVVLVDRRERIGDRRPGVRVLLANIALHGFVVAVRVGIDGSDLLPPFQ